MPTISEISTAACSSCILCSETNVSRQGIC